MSNVPGILNFLDEVQSLFYGDMDDPGSHFQLKTVKPQPPIANILPLSKRSVIAMETARNSIELQMSLSWTSDERHQYLKHRNHRNSDVLMPKFGNCLLEFHKYWTFA